MIGKKKPTDTFSIAQHYKMIFAPVFETSSKIPLSDRLDEISSSASFSSRRDEETLLNRHHETYFPQKIYRVPAVRRCPERRSFDDGFDRFQEARKSIETIDTVDPVRVAKIGVVYIALGQVRTSRFETHRSFEGVRRLGNHRRKYSFEYSHIRTLSTFHESIGDSEIDQSSARREFLFAFTRCE